MARFLALAATLLCAFAPAVTAVEVVKLENDEAFEEKVIQSRHVWAVLFTSGRAGDDSAEALKVIEEVATTVDSFKIGVADVDAVKAFASEFNVRKRMAPRMLVFNSRARQAEVIALKGAVPWASALLAQIKLHLKENALHGAHYEKVTLAIGGKDEL